MDGKPPVNSDGSNMMDRKADLKALSVVKLYYFRSVKAYDSSYFTQAILNRI